MVKGGPLTSDTFWNYTPYCSFNKDGYIKQEILDAVNEVVSLETPGPPQQVETQESDMSDDIAKVRESERICHQEQALEEAETWKVLTDMYEGWNFNFVNAAVTFDTAHLQSSYFHRPSMYSPKLCRTRSQR